MKPPPLKDDCFAMPPGVSWTPVEDALAMLRDGLHCVVASEVIALELSGGRILADDVVALRSNPPYANSAVDGYGFAFANLPQAEVYDLPLGSGRAAAGAPYNGVVPDGTAVRTLTGAQLPDGVDTVVLEEDCSVEVDRIAFRSGIRAGANTRAAGEDICAGDVALTAGHKLRAQDLALLAAIGVSVVSVRKQLRVAVLSTGDEVVPVGETAKPSQIYDANRPMLIEAIRAFGYEPIDLGHAADSAKDVSEAFEYGAQMADAILTSGGASAGDEDHVSAVLSERGAMQTWRIAVKPGRPLALALWNGVPVFGLPGNPVAALVCTLVFACPAMSVLAGTNWQEPVGFDVPAAFTKNKKAGRREFLRARMCDGRAEVFKSEGSGRISGLSWAEGLVELREEAQHITDGDMVRFYPYAAFGI